MESHQENDYEIVTNESLTHHDFLFKLIIIGDTGVGKSCLLSRAMDGEFKEEHNVTIGVEFGSFVIKHANKVIKLQIWDTAGQDSFRSITRIFYRGAHCVFLTYDVTREETFESLKEWLREIREHSIPDIAVFLVGNQKDEIEDRQVDHEKAMAFANENQFNGFFETSAKTGEGVDALFVKAAIDLYSGIRENKSKQDQLKKDDDIRKTAIDLLNTKPKQKKKGCC